MPHQPLNPYTHYFEAAKYVNWPPSWYLTGVKDKALGHADDVLNFIEETANTEARFSLLSRQAGNAVDYDHIDILTHPEAISDHFPLISQWMKAQE
ncbi:hypothetical protein [Pseudoalteromonas sp. S1688]|uniref:hypothetical protein n=1 Tax=Pseudoalteromonas sp. S1688 TaxID=579511 RepID=UPI00110B770C|nr:hypothetical protein [Pseudoalteromonas sp. S1688]TMP50225.1 hypothetical protein CWB81_11380 [Pseudoalteromonas sp. S1688]